ncbi:MAG: hypothetical protein CENE_01604 [Candidatus Celerinatantimonas neptuna]|nr:MAG: hypothetical protein CENE_01604 [Candidatus Celerinatantimonas neptuna]
MSYCRLLTKKHIKTSLITFAVISAINGCYVKTVQSHYQENYRPQLQFSPAKYWMNDPNGLVFYNGEYHMFYQYNPNGNSWGDMSWGHAVSHDKIHWETLPIALTVKKDEEDEATEMFFSGSAVVDARNTSGFGTKDNPPMVAMYTSNYPQAITLYNGKKILAGMQAQSIAYSLDKGRTWIQYANNPVIEKPPAFPINYESEYKNFRDPKMFWSGKYNKWIMVAVLAKQHKALFYESHDLVNWHFMSEFGPMNAANGLWECPDLFELPIDGHLAHKKWVLIININPGGPAGGSGSQYFIGDFDGTRFVADKESQYDNTPPFGNLIENFEGSYDSIAWTATGDFPGQYLAYGNQTGQQGVKNYQGNKILNTYTAVPGSDSANGSDTPTGTITSPSFTIQKKYIDFMIGGGNHAHNPAQSVSTETSINLLIHNKVVRSSTGTNTETMSWRSWNVAAFLGKRAQIQVIDQNTGSWGHILLDHIIQSDAPKITANWSDFGSDFYAASSWNNVPNDKRLWVGWMSNWSYAGNIPTSPWRGTQTFIRELELQKINGRIRLTQVPVHAFNQLRRQMLFHHQRAIMINSDDTLLSNHQIKAKVFEIQATLNPAGADNIGFKIRTNGQGQITRVGYDALAGTVYIDRTHSGDSSFSTTFATRHNAPVTLEKDGKLNLRIIVDTSSVSVFADKGEVVLTDQIFPDPSSTGMDMFSEGGSASIEGLTIWKLNSIWTKKSNP